MRIKLDENLPARLVLALQRLGHDADTTVDEGLSGRPDDEVWTAAQASTRFLVTQDLDFSDVRRFAPGSHFGLLIVRLPDEQQWRVAEFIERCLALDEARSWGGCLVVASPARLRVRRPPSGDRGWCECCWWC